MRAPPGLDSALDETALLHAGGRSGRWGNLGCWPAPGEPETDYAGACAELARRVAEAAGGLRGARLLVPGCGAGEEMRLWREQGAVECVGVDPDPRHRRDSADGVRTLTGAACDMHRLAGGGFDAVLACDSAYHFGPHAGWLAAAAAALRPGGRLAFTDLVLEPRGVVQRAAASGLTWAMRRPAVDIAPRRSAACVCQALEAAGFDDVSVTRIDEPVLGGFVRFVAAQQERLGVQAQSPAWRRVAVTARALPLCRAFGLGMALFGARRR